MAFSISNCRRRSFKGLVVTILVAILATAIFNLAIDPYATFRWVDIPSLNRIKPYPDHDLETIKAHALRHVVPDALILGNSRAEVGFDPTHPVWHEAGYRSVYNAAIPGSLPASSWRLLQEAAHIKPPRFVLLGIDFFDFPIPADLKPEPAETQGTPRPPSIRWMLRASLTLQALLDSVNTLRRQYQRNPEQLTTLGHNPLLDYQNIVRVDGYWVLFRQRAEENAKNHGRKPKNLYLNDSQSSPRFDDIRRIVRWAVENNCELRLVIYPYHAQLLSLIDQLGFWPLFEEWKRQILAIIQQEAGHTGNKISLIDYSGYSAYARDLIPTKGDKETATRWYWEAGHFKKELGDHMLDEMLSLSGQASAAFGITLRQSNIDQHIHALREEKKHYQATNPLVVREIQEILDKTMGKLGRD